MSIDIRFLNNGKKEVIRVRNTGVTPAQVDFYEKREDLPQDIRNYCPKTSKYADPDIAYMLGCGEQLYPNQPMCILNEYRGKRCIERACEYWDKSSGKCNETAKGADKP